MFQLTIVANSLTLIFCLHHRALSTVLESNNRRCSVVAILSQQEECISSSFPAGLWYYDHIEQICQYVRLLRFSSVLLVSRFVAVLRSINDTCIIIRIMIQKMHQVSSIKIHYCRCIIITHTLTTYQYDQSLIYSHWYFYYCSLSAENTYPGSDDVNIMYWTLWQFYLSLVGKCTDVRRFLSHTLGDTFSRPPMIKWAFILRWYKKRVVRV